VSYAVDLSRVSDADHSRRTRTDTGAEHALSLSHLPDRSAVQPEHESSGARAGRRHAASWEPTDTRGRPTRAIPRRAPGGGSERAEVVSGRLQEAALIAPQVLW